LGDAELLISMSLSIYHPARWRSPAIALNGHLPTQCARYNQEFAAAILITVAKLLNNIEDLSLALRQICVSAVA
jgi:hypothetical protein